VGGSDRVVFTALICKGTGKISRHDNASRISRTKGSGGPLTNGPTGSMANTRSVVSSFRLVQRSMARRARVAAYSHGKRPGTNCDCVRTRSVPVVDG
jgi:hypothetical protein